MLVSPHWAARLDGLVRARPFERWAASHLRTRPFQFSIIRVAMPDDPEDKSERPLLEAFSIAILLWLIMAVLFAVGLYWFW